MPKKYGHGRMNAKEIAWDAYWESYSRKCGTPTPTHRRAARTMFERWWVRNHE